MKLNELNGKKIKIKQIKSGSKFNDRKKASIAGLGLRGIGSVSELVATPSVIGMISKVNNIIKII